MVGLVDNLSPAALSKQDTPVPIGPISKFAVKRIAQAKCHVPEDEVLARCLNQIRTLLLMDLQATELGITLYNLAGGLDESADILQVLKDYFAKKATGTILKRTSAVWSLAVWMLEHEQTAVWTITENTDLPLHVRSEIRAWRRLGPAMWSRPYIFFLTLI